MCETVMSLRLWLSLCLKSPYLFFLNDDSIGSWLEKTVSASKSEPSRD